MGTLTYILVVVTGLVVVVLLSRPNTLESSPSAPETYPKAGTVFIYELIRLLDLTDWENGLPLFSEEEKEAIQKRLDDFQRDANQKMGDRAVFHPDAAPVIQRQIGSEALKKLVSEQDFFPDDDELPWNWRELVSTYLKAWVMNLDPMVLIDVSGLLTRAGYKKEARDALNVVVSHFKGYAPKFFAGADHGNTVTDQVINAATMRMSRL